MENKNIRNAVRNEYANIARQNSSCCGPSGQTESAKNTYNSCCRSNRSTVDVSKEMGYSDSELDSLPEGANLGLGCGNPVALAALKEGDTYLDLGSGAGIDCFLAAQKVGKSGTVIGVDMTPEMIDRARQNAEKGNYENVKFRLGEIENLPVADNVVDVITSNCVINLSPDKKAVFDEAFRVLKPGGKLMISDVVLTKPLHKNILDSLYAYVDCISGAMLKDEYLDIVKSVGFEEIKIEGEVSTPPELWMNDPLALSVKKQFKLSDEEVKEFAGSIVSLKFSAVKPADS